MFRTLSGGGNLLLDWELNGEQGHQGRGNKDRKYPHPTGKFPALLNVIAKKSNARNLGKKKNQKGTHLHLPRRVT